MNEINAKEFLEGYPLYKKVPAETMLIIDEKFRRMVALSAVVSSHNTEMPEKSTSYSLP